MAALQVKEDSATGQLTLRSPLAARLGSSAFGLIWVVLLGAFFVLPMLSSGNIDWSNLLFVLVIFGFSGGSSLLSALMSTTVTIDTSTRTLSHARQLLVFPLGGAAVSFGDIESIEVQRVRRSSRNSSGNFAVSAVARDGRRVPLNWNGGQSEMQGLAQKVSALTGAPVAEAAYQMPAAATEVLKRIAPDVEQMVEQPESAPAPSPTDAPASNELPGTEALPAENVLTMPTADAPNEAKPAAEEDLSGLSADALEQRIQGDPMDSDARYALARKYHAQRQLDQAIAMYQEVMRTDPTNSGAQNDLGIAFQQRGKRAEAEAAYRRAVALDPFSSTAHLNLALLLRDMKRATEASQEFFQARQNARGDDETRAAEAASAGGRMEPLMSKT